MNLPIALQVFPPLMAAVAILIGTGAVLFPRRAAEGYGLAAEGAALGYVRATGVRDIFLGLTFLVLWHFAQWSALAYVCLAGALVAAVDCAVVKTTGTTKLWIVHFAGFLVLATYGAWILTL